MSGFVDGTDLLSRLTSGDVPDSFALVHRPESGSPDGVDLFVGEVSEVATTADIPLTAPDVRGQQNLLVVLPYQQIAERGFEHCDDGTPLLLMDIHEQTEISADDVLSRLPNSAINVGDLRFDIDDEQYAEIVRRVVTDEIGTGSGANFVIKRTLTAEIDNWSVATELALFGRLLRQSSGAYWTFLIHTGDRTLIGASPERHVTLDRGTATMNPISGTYRYPASGPSLDGVLEFLADHKEANELYMVVDEELKMMSGLCDHGCRVVGPHLREMEHLAHTEYFIEGSCTRDVREVIRETLFAPTVTGSPLESASRVIAKYEPEGRGYYAGMAALIGTDTDGGRSLDSAILIRTADLDVNGRMRLGAGSTLVRDSDPHAEAAETRAKAAGLLSALESQAADDVAKPQRPRLNDVPEIDLALRERNIPLADFWRSSPEARIRRETPLLGRRALLIDGEDTFTKMGASVLRELGLDVTVCRFDSDYDIEGNDLVVVGPGPGDPRAVHQDKISQFREVTLRLLQWGGPLLSICLGHQILSRVLGLSVIRKEQPNQGVQREIDLFEHTEPVYFYNTFAAVCAERSFPCPVGRTGIVEVCRDPINDEVHALRGPGFASVQFHPASVMTRNGGDVLERLITDLFPIHESATSRDHEVAT